MTGSVLSRNLVNGSARLLRRMVAVGLLAGLLAACQADEVGYGPKHLRQVPRETRTEMAKLNMSESAPVLMRIFKEESTFEVWKKDKTGRYALLKTYEICSWSGKLGPKIKEGDRQAPEGYYMITPALMNPNSSYHLAFNTGFPNSYDRAHGRTGTHLMVHGACSSRGCYAMTDAQIQEIYALARDAFRGGQAAFQLQAYPFRMTPENMARHMGDPNMPFWRMLKEGYDHFELTRQEPKVDVCGRKYVFNVTAKGPMSPAAACPALELPESLRIAAARKASEDDARMMEIAARLEGEKRQEEERLVALASAEAEEARRAEERRIAAEERARKLKSLFGGEEETEIAVAPAPLPAVDAAGVPLPRPAPGREASVMALAPPEAEKPNRSIFSTMFADDEAAATAAPAPEAGAAPATTAAEAAPSEPAASQTEAVAAAPATMAPAQPPVAAASPAAGTETSPSCTAPGAPPVEGVAACPVPEAAAAPPANAGEAGIINRIGNWF